MHTDKKCKVNKQFDFCILNYLCESVSICGDKAFVFRRLHWKIKAMYY